MKTGKFTTRSICSIVCALFLIGALVIQFVPFWNVGEAVSISGYVWLPTNHTDLTEYFKQAVNPDFRVESLVLFSLIQMFAPISGFILTLYYRNDKYLTLSGAITGVSGLWNLLNASVLRCGQLWQVIAAISIVLLIASIFWVFIRRKESQNP